MSNFGNNNQYTTDSYNYLQPNTVEDDNNSSVYPESAISVKPLIDKNANSNSIKYFTWIN
jgi:hypothetical protein